MPSSSHGRTNSRRALSSRQMMALEAARLYHLRGLDQAAVAQVLHVSRPQVSKLLATARESGYIRTHVVDPRESDRELVQTVTQRFRIAGLLLVSPTGPTSSDLLNALGSGAAHLTNNLVLPGEEDVSFWWSQTVQACALEMARAPLRPRAWYQCAGTAPGHNTHLSMKSFMERTDLVVHPCPVPLLHPSVTARVRAEKSPAARQHESRRVTSAVLILGSCREDMELIRRSDLVTSQEREQIDRNAVGHLCGRFIDADGRVVAPTLGQRTSSPTLAQLRRSKRTVLITYGARQIEFVRAAALAGYVDHIVTDVSTAELLLKYT